VSLVGRNLAIQDFLQKHARPLLPRLGEDLRGPTFLGGDHADLACPHIEVGRYRPGYGEFWGMRSGSGLVLGSGDRLAVAETDTANNLGEAVGAVQSAPVALG
jgi:hypothetical protein